VVTTAVEKIDDTRVKLTVTVEARRVTEAIDATVQRLAGSMRIPGFRPGRAPLRVVESRLGRGAVAEEAARDVLPEWYAEAVRGLGEEVTVVGPPSFEVDAFDRDADGVFTATVDVRPDVPVPDYRGLEVAHPEWQVTDEEVEENLGTLRQRFAELEAVDRPARRGDYVTVTLSARTADGADVPEASAEDLLYPIPEEDTDSELDRVLVGAAAGAVLTFEDDLGPDYGPELAGQRLAFTAIVKEVKVQQLPDLDDDFAVTASEFDTIEELRADLRAQLQREKLQLAVANVRAAVVEAVAGLVEVPLPESLVEEEQRFRLNRLAHQAEHSGIPFDRFLELAGGGDPQALVDRIRADAEETVKAQLVVDEVGQAAGVTVEQQDLSEEVARQAVRLGRDPQEIAQLMLHPERIGALYADAYRRKAIDHLLEEVTITGAPPEELVQELLAAPQERGGADDEDEVDEDEVDEDQVDADDEE
jgi:trigger factor